jgi:hypothetical protein
MLQRGDGHASSVIGSVHGQHRVGNMRNLPRLQFEITAMRPQCSTAAPSHQHPWSAILHKQVGGVPVVWWRCPSEKLYTADRGEYKNDSYQQSVRIYTSYIYTFIYYADDEDYKLCIQKMFSQ